MPKNENQKIITWKCTACNTTFEAPVCACAPNCPNCNKSTSVMTLDGYQNISSKNNDINFLI